MTLHTEDRDNIFKASTMEFPISNILPRAVLERRLPDLVQDFGSSSGMVSLLWLHSLIICEVVAASMLTRESRLTHDRAIIPTRYSLSCSSNAISPIHDATTQSHHFLFYSNKRLAIVSMGLELTICSWYRCGHL